MAGRRERLRAEAIRDIKAAALGHLREHGAADLSLRAVARECGMSAPGLYRYYDGRDDLLTALIADSYNDLADHLLVAIGAPTGELSGSDRPRPEPTHRADAHDDVADRTRAAFRTYREWARTHPNEFGLIYGDPIPGYAAPEEGVTVVANRRVGLTLGRLYIDAWRQGRLRVHSHFADAAITDALGPLSAVVGDEVPRGAAAAMLAAWSRLHGIVSLEVFGQFDWLFGDDAEPLFEAELAAHLSDLGIAPQAGQLLSSPGSSSGYSGK